MGLFATLSINDTQLNSNESYYADCPIFIVMLSVVMLSVVMLSVVTPSVVMA